MSIRFIPGRAAVIGVFPQREQAERALEDLRRLGFRRDQLGFVVRGGEATARGPRWPAAPAAPASDRTEASVAEDASSGVLAGGLAGGLLGAAATLLIPGLGPAIAGGALATALSGAVAGAAAGSVAGGLGGAFAGLGVPDEEARYYDRAFDAGRTIVAVRADGRGEEAAAVLSRYGAYDYRAAGEGRHGRQDAPVAPAGV